MVGKKPFCHIVTSSLLTQILHQRELFCHIVIFIIADAKITSDETQAKAIVNLL
jgi:hypothetical protein